MTTARTLFPGAMGPEGFISCFDHLMDDALLRRKLILKGGPGVGKSTFMRRVHAALCANGEPSTLYFCSGDPIWTAWPFRMPGCSFWTAPRRTSSIPKFPARGTASLTSANA
ncbi:MAG: hypothetical protein ACLTBF_06390 [Christensenellales bacterium]